MFLAEKTVKNYVSRLLAKLGMERRTQAAVFASKLEQQSSSPTVRQMHRQAGHPPQNRVGFTTTRRGLFSMSAS